MMILEAYNIFILAFYTKILYSVLLWLLSLGSLLLCFVCLCWPSLGERLSKFGIGLAILLNSKSLWSIDLPSHYLMAKGTECFEYEHSQIKKISVRETKDREERGRGWVVRRDSSEILQKKWELLDIKLLRLKLIITN